MWQSSDIIYVVDWLGSVKIILMLKEIYVLLLDRFEFYCYGCLFWISVMFVNMSCD